MEAPEIASGVVEIKSIAREAGSRSKKLQFIPMMNTLILLDRVSNKGVRVTTVMGELNGEKIDIIPWSILEDMFQVAIPTNVINIEVNEEEHKAVIDVAPDQLSLAIGKGGQNVRLAAKLTGWRIDIKGIAEDEIKSIRDEEEDLLDDGIVDDGAE